MGGMRLAVQLWQRREARVYAFVQQANPQQRHRCSKPDLGFGVPSDGGEACRSLTCLLVTRQGDRGQE